MFDIINATRRSARALATMQKHARAIRDAQRNNDEKAELKASRAYAAALNRYHAARYDASFPWERKA